MKILPILLLISMPAVASDLHYNIHLGSVHINAEQEYNERNPGLGIDYRTWIAGVYRNSLDNVSVYAGKSFELSQHFGIKAGLVTGYDDPVSPMIAGYARVSHFEVVIIPPSPKSPVTIGFGLRF